MQETEQTLEPVILPKESIKDAFQNTVIRLISRHEYYAHILLQLKVSFIDNPKLTLGVGISNSQVHLYIGNDFFLNSSDDQRVFYLQHEMAHIMLGHLGLERRGNVEDHKIMNIAMDTAIHEILTQSKSLFPDKEFMQPCTVESLREMCKDDTIKNNETTEYYFNFLKTLKDDLKEKLKDFKFDEHNFAEKESEANIDIGKALTVGILEKAKEKMAAGTIPGEAELTIEKYKKNAKNWRAILRRYATSMVDNNTKVTKNKRNRRYGFIIPGKKKTFNPKIVAIVDTSGSMDSDRIAKVFVELVRMEKQGYEILLIEADAKVQKVREFSSRGNIKFNGGGGTLYQPALDQAAKLNPDVCIYMTDLDPADSPVKPRFNMIWLDVSGGSGFFKPDFGTIITVED